MLFTIDRTEEAEKALLPSVSGLIDLALAQGGTFYLPYRNYANTKQLLQAYPELENFISSKKKADPKKYLPVIFIPISSNRQIGKM